MKSHQAYDPLGLRKKRNPWYEDRIDADKDTRTVPLRSCLPCCLAIGLERVSKTEILISWNGL